MRIPIILFLSFLAFEGAAQDSSTWDLQRCISYALEQNNSLKQYDLQLSVQNNNLQQSKWNRSPALNASGNQNYNVGRSIDPFTNTFSTQTFQSNSFSLSAGMVLYNGGRLNKTIASNELGLNAMYAGKQALENQISLAVASAYLLILQSEANLELSQEQLELTQAQLSQAEQRVQVGQDNRSAQLALQAQLAMDRSALVNARNQIQLAYNQLMNLLQLPLDRDFRIAQPRIDPLPTETVTARSLLEEAALRLPELQEARILEQQAHVNTQIARASLYPSISAYGNLGTVYSESGVEYSTSMVLMPIGFVKSTNEEVLSLVPVSTITEKSFNDQIRDNFGQSFGLSISVPILNGRRNRTALENAKLNEQLSKLNTESRVNTLRTDITTALTNQQAALANYQAAQASEEAQRLNYQFLQERHSAGLATETEMLQAKNNWRQAQVTLSNAKYELVFRNMIIEFYKGKPIQL